MTLCVAWVRNAAEPQELFFATDSRLRGLGVWDSGIKLFELSNISSLIAFHGGTELAYTLLHHLSENLLRSDEILRMYSDASDLIEKVAQLFSELAEKIAELPDERDKQKTGFLFGSWSWRQNAFAIWRVSYDLEQHRFVPEPVSLEAGRVVAFLGGEEDAPNEAANELNELIKGGPIDLQPLTVLSNRVSPNKNTSTVGGPIQVARIHRSGVVEFLGVMWNGKRNWRCADLPIGMMPEMQLVNIETGEEVAELPRHFANWREYDFGVDTAFIERCYNNGDQLVGDLRPEERRKLLRLLRGIAYSDFVKRLEDSAAIPS